MNGHFDIVEYLTKFDHSLIYEETSGHICALQAAIMNNHIDIIKLMINKGAASKYDYNETGDLFLLASQYNSMETIKILDNELEIPYSKPIDYRYSYFPTRQLTWGDLFIQQACDLENLELASFLLSKNCNFDRLNSSENFNHDWSPFLDFLIENGLDLSRPCDEFTNPLIVNVISTGNLKRVKKMISKGFELNADIISQYNCIKRACAKGKVDLFNFLMSFNPRIDDIFMSLTACLDGYLRTRQKKHGGKNFLYFITTLIELQNIDINSALINDFVCKAASSRALEILQIFAKHGFDFTHCKLNCSYMKIKDYLPIYEFLEDHGCVFDNIVCGYNDIKCN